MHLRQVEVNIEYFLPVGLWPQLGNNLKRVHVSMNSEHNT